MNLIAPSILSNVSASIVSGTSISSSISSNTLSAAASALCRSVKIFAISLIGPENFLEYKTNENRSL